MRRKESDLPKSTMVIRVLMYSLVAYGRNMDVSLYLCRQLPVTSAKKLYTDMK